MSKDQFSVDYALTITLLPKIYKYEPEQQYDLTYDHILRKLKSLTNYFTLVAEVTKSINLHMHCIIKFPLIKGKLWDKEIKKLFRQDPFVGFTCMKQVEDFNGWVEYVRKDLDKSLQYLNRRPIIYDTYDVFDLKDRARLGVDW